MNITNIITIFVICFVTTPVINGSEISKKRPKILEEQLHKEQCHTLAQIVASYQRQKAILVLTHRLDNEHYKDLVPFLINERSHRSKL